jgi:hypothetical protein
VSYRVGFDDAGRTCLYRYRVPDWPHPVPKGERSTSQLSPRAVRVIKGAAVKAALNGIPIVAMWSFTLSPRVRLANGSMMDARKAVATGGIVLSEEMSRTLNALRMGLKRKGLNDDFEYLWVAENPPSKATGHDWIPGTRNPHVHLLTTLLVPYADFRTFTTWLESLWGLGFVHAERIKDPQAAAYYLLKCVGYVSKGAKATVDEPIKGQRWACSRGIRPVPGTIEDVEFDEGIELGLWRLAKRAEVEGNLRCGRAFTFTPWTVLGNGHEPGDFVNLVCSLVEYDLVPPRVAEELGVPVEEAEEVEEEDPGPVDSLPDWSDDFDPDDLEVVEGYEQDSGWVLDPLF